MATNQDNRISNIQKWFKYVIDGNSINSGENKGTKSLNFQEFVINLIEYLTNCEICLENKSITYIYSMINKDISFSVGNRIGNQIYINIINNTKKEKVIISIFGRYSNLMNEFGFHLINKSEYFELLFKSIWIKKINNIMKDGKYK